MRRTKTYQPRPSRLDNPHWQLFKNSRELAQQVYDLTHPWQMNLSNTRPIEQMDCDRLIALRSRVNSDLVLS